MCFSASASFIAGTTLCAVGVVTLSRTKSKAERPFALIPLLFGIQQLVEGVIWLTFRHDVPVLRQTMTYLYSGFSHVLWPIYVPLAVGLLETVRWRRKVIFVFMAAGIMVSLYLAYFLVVSPVVAQVVDQHIAYVSPHFYVLPMMGFYLVATCVSCFFSSHRFVRLFGGLLLLSFITAYFIQITTLVSVWCFFAAVLSLLIYFHFRFRDFGTFQKQLRSPRPAPAVP